MLFCYIRFNICLPHILQIKVNVQLVEILQLRTYVFKTKFNKIHLKLPY